MRLHVVERPGTGIVTTVLWCSVGCRDERPGHWGLAHFVEHMMFRGSPRFGTGEIDRFTVERGGDNNAFTDHDATVYYFRFAAEYWSGALALEADRMTELCFEPDHLAREKEVVLEEIATAENEPWDALETAVVAAFYGGHPYGRPVLGDRKAVGGFDAADVTGFHRQFYRPSNVLMTIAGDVTLDQALRAAEPLGALDIGSRPSRDAAPLSALKELQRVERRRGDIDRMLLVLPAWSATKPGNALLGLLAAVLTRGRQSRLHRRLVEEQRLCAWISADVSELEHAGHWSLALEVLPGVEPQRVEDTVLAELAALAVEPPTADELLRSQRQLLADWLFGHEKVEAQAFAAAHEEAFLGRGWSERTMERIATATADDVADTVAELGSFDPSRGAALGWSFADD